MTGLESSKESPLLFVGIGTVVVATVAVTTLVCLWVQRRRSSGCPSTIHLPGMPTHARDSSLEYTNPVYGGIGNNALQTTAELRQRPCPQAAPAPNQADHYTWTDELGGSSSIPACPRKDSVVARLLDKLRSPTSAAIIKTTAEGGCSIAVPDTAAFYQDLEYHNPLFDARRGAKDEFFWADEIEEARTVAMVDADTGTTAC